MTADEFVAALGRAGRQYADPREAAACRAWVSIPRLAAPAFDHPPDPVLDLLSQYDLSGVAFWQLAFVKGVPVRWGGDWQVARKATDDYYVDGGTILKMYYKEAFPSGTGLTSGQFLDLVAVYAEMIAALPPDRSAGRVDAAVAEYAARAAAISPHVHTFNWFDERRAAIRERDRPAALTVRLALPGALARSAVGYALREPDADVNPDDAVLRFLRGAAGHLVPKWTRSVRRYGETSAWSRRHGSDPRRWRQGASPWRRESGPIAVIVHRANSVAERFAIVRWRLVRQWHRSISCIWRRCRIDRGHCASAWPGAPLAPAVLAWSSSMPLAPDVGGAGNWAGWQKGPNHWWAQ